MKLEAVDTPIIVFEGMNEDKSEHAYCGGEYRV